MDVKETVSCQCGTRVREAYDAGATVLAVACPICMMMLEDAVKTEGLEEELIIRDISQIVRESL